MPEQKESELKTYSLQDVKGHKDSKSTWIVIDNRVFDVTKFLEEVIICHVSCDILWVG